MTVFMSNEEMVPKEGWSDAKVEKSGESADEDVELDIPVFKNVWNSKYTLIGKLIWMLIIISCTTMVFVQVINRVQFYMSLPVSVSMHIQDNQTLTYPDVTVCPISYDGNSYREVQKEIANISGINATNVNATSVPIDDILKHMTIMDLWQRVCFPLEDIIYNCSIEKNPCNAVGQWRSTISVLGICYTYSSQRPLNVSGKSYGLEIILKTLSTASSWRILLHDHDVSPKAKAFTESISINSNIAMDIQVQLRQFRLKSTDSKPCLETKSDDCDVKCLSDLILKKCNCRLPFMENVEAPYCSPPYHSIAENLLKQVLLGQEKGCACLPECNLDYYETYVDSTYYPNRNVTQVRIFYENFRFTRIAEEYSYGFVPLLSDIGGTLGLFLGFSILTVVDIIGNLVMKLKRSWQRKKHKKEISHQDSIKSIRQNSKT